MNVQNMRIATLTAVTVGCAASVAQAQWISYNNQTSTRMIINLPDIANDAIGNNTDSQERDYAKGDVDNDGDLDVVVVRKRPLSCTIGKRNVLLMNENGVLVDRTTQYATSAINVPAAQGVSQGFLDNTNDRQGVLIDVNNDGWLDLVTCTTMSDGQHRYIGHPRIYMNLGEVGGVWQGFQYDYNRFPQMLAWTGNPPNMVNPRFCSVAAGDITGDGYADLYFIDYDTPENSYCGVVSESTSNDTQNKLLINQGAANPGFFVDESIARMGATVNWPTGQNMLYSQFGAHGLIVDVNMDGFKDVVKISTLVSPIHTGIMHNNAGTGFFAAVNYKGYTASSGATNATYSVASGDLDRDGRMDLVYADDSPDRWARNTGTDANGNTNFTSYVLTSAYTNESQFGGQVTIADLDKDGWLDVIIYDQDLDTNFPGNTSNCTSAGCRRTHVYKNSGNPGSPANLLREQNPTILPISSTIAIYNGVVFDLDNDGWNDIIFGHGSPQSGNHTSGGYNRVWISNGKPSLDFGFPETLPNNLMPGAATTFNVQLTGTHSGTPMANSGKIHISVNGDAFVQSAMTPLGGDVYEATIPAGVCLDHVRFYFSGQVTNGTTLYYPSGPTYASAPTSYLSAYVGDSTSASFSDEFEAGAAGWTVQNEAVTGGAWVLAVPNGTWNDGIRANAHEDSTPDGTQCFVTGNGAAGEAPGLNDLDGGPTHLVSPTIDLAGSNALISYARWLYSSTIGDTLTVSVSNDNGATWTTVKTYDSVQQPDFSGSSDIIKTVWVSDSFAVSDFVTPTSQVKVRFSAVDNLPAGIYEAGIDDFAVNEIGCKLQPCPADINNSGAVDVTDLLAVISAWGPCPGCPADIDGSGTVDVTDLLAVINGWGSCP